jgi:hypothetical protein
MKQNEKKLTHDHLYYMMNHLGLLPSIFLVFFSFHFMSKKKNTIFFLHSVQSKKYIKWNEKNAKSKNKENIL